MTEARNPFAGSGTFRDDPSTPMSIDLNSLDAFSQAFASRLFAIYPDWQRHARPPKGGRAALPAGHQFPIASGTSLLDRHRQP